MYDGDINDHVKYLYSILYKAADLSLKKWNNTKIINHKAKNKPQNKKWFDNTCYSMHRQVKFLGKTLCNNPYNSYIRGRFFRMQNEYKKTV